MFLKGYFCLFALFLLSANVNCQITDIVKPSTSLPPEPTPQNAPLPLQTASQPVPQPAPQPVPQPVAQPTPQLVPQPNALPVPRPGPANATQAPAPAVRVDDICLQCICHASTECKLLKCHVAGPSQYFCGPYLISWAYWADAGKPNDDPSNPYAFEACLNDKACSELTIRQYMAKHGRDCNGDGVINCLDVARIHKAGPTGCGAPWIDDTPYWKTMLTCKWA